MSGTWIQEEIKNMEDKKEKPKKYGFATIPPSIYKGREENITRLDMYVWI